MEFISFPVYRHVCWTICSGRMRFSQLRFLVSRGLPRTTSDDQKNKSNVLKDPSECSHRSLSSLINRSMKLLTFSYCRLETSLQIISCLITPLACACVDGCANSQILARLVSALAETRAQEERVFRLTAASEPHLHRCRSPHGVVCFVDPAPPRRRPPHSGSRCRSCSHQASSWGTSSSLQMSEH